MKPLERREKRLVFGALVLVLGLRLATLGAYPLTDSTESRYAEIARKMAVLGDWVTPWFDWGVPFWGKPPLAIWLSAGSMRLFGVSEFAARVPSFLVGLCLIGLVVHLVRRQSGADSALTAALVLATTVLFFLCSGAVLTDMALAFTVTLGMVAFWRMAHAGPGARGYWGHLLFASLGLGMLAKGPIALVLTGTPIGLWLLLTGRWREILPRLPWVIGVLLMVAIALPWYAAAERNTPGFLEYFLVGENFRRFIDPTWAGDLYGSTHAHPHGYIWLLWLAAVLPWSPIAIGMILRRVRPGRCGQDAAAFTVTGPWRIYLALFTLVPVFFFTFCGSVLPTYVIPGVPALSILVAEWWMTYSGPNRVARLLALALPVPVLFVALLPLFNSWVVPDVSQKGVLSALPAGTEVIYYPERPFSGEFYTQGRAQQAGDADTLARKLREAPASYVVTCEGVALPTGLRGRYTPVHETGRKRKAVLWAPRDRFAVVR